MIKPFLIRPKDFLEDLQHNNSKEWMDENRKRYHSAKQYWLEEVDAIPKCQSNRSYRGILSYAQAAGELA